MQLAISICLLRELPFGDTAVARHRPQLTDMEQERRLKDALQLHTVELAKYNVGKETLEAASQIEKWVSFLLYADRYDADRVR